MPRVAVAYRTASTAAYRNFCSRHPDIHITIEQWRQIIYTYNHCFRDYILETGERIKLPWGLGTFSITKRKAKKSVIHQGEEKIVLPIDWQKSNKLGKRIYHLNTHTDGYRYKWAWFPQDARILQPYIWVFKPSRISSRKIAEYLKKPNSIYPQIYKQWIK